MEKKIVTVDRLINALGGPTAVGKWLGIKQSAVSNWSLRGEIPPGWHLRLYMEAQKRGFRVDDELFGLEVVGRPAVGSAKKKTMRREHASVAMASGRA